MLKISETVYSVKDAMAFTHRGFTGVSYDSKLQTGEWYYQSSPNEINYVPRKTYSKW